MSNNTIPEVGEFIEIPAWKTFGRVMDVKTAPLGSEKAIQVLLQEHPDQPARAWRSYRLEPNEYILEGFSS